MRSLLPNAAKIISVMENPGTNLLERHNSYKKNPESLDQIIGDSGLYKNFSAASYSPTQSPKQYHRRKRA